MQAAREIGTDMKKIIIVTGSVRKIGGEPAKASEEWTAKGYYLDSCSDIGDGKAKLVFKKVKGWKDDKPA